MSAIPAVLDALLALMRGRHGYGTPGKNLTRGLIPVLDGLDLRDADSTRALVIGSTVLADSERVADSGLGYSLDSTDEVIQVTCSAMAWTGDDGDAVSTLRPVVFAIVTDLEQALAVNRNLGGAAVDARLTRVAYRVAYGDDLVLAADCSVRVMA